MEIVACVSAADRVVSGAMAWLRRATCAADIAEAMALLAQMLELEQARCTGGDVSVACGPGCAACCIVNVSVLMPEAVAIASYLRRTVPGDRLAQTGDLLSAFAERVRWMDDSERPLHRLACPFLDKGGCCIIHPVRPLLCRSISSIDPASCDEALKEGGMTVVMNLPQRVLCNLVFSGMGTALQERGLDSRSLELSRMVAGLLREPRLIDDFLGGRRATFP